MTYSSIKQPTYEEALAKKKAREEKLRSKPRKYLKRSNIAKSPKKRVAGQKTTKKTPSKKERSISKLKKELDRVFSIYIRQRDNGQCFTCPNKNDYKKMQNGHFVPRQYLAVRWDETNCNCQCYACNMRYGGQGATYAIR